MRYCKKLREHEDEDSALPPASVNIYQTIRYNIPEYSTLHSQVCMGIPPEECRLLGCYAVVPSSPILVTLMIEVPRSPKRQFLQEACKVTSQKTAFFKFIYDPSIMSIALF
jgi:hypothetical protein